MLKSSQAEEKHAPAKMFTTELEEVDELKVQFSALINQNATEKAAAEDAAAQEAKTEEMLVANLPDPPSESPNEGDRKDEEIQKKLSKLKKFNKKLLDDKIVKRKVKITVCVADVMEHDDDAKVVKKKIDTNEEESVVNDDDVNKSSEFDEEICVTKTEEITVKESDTNDVETEEKAVISRTKSLGESISKETNSNLINTKPNDADIEAA